MKKYYLFLGVVGAIDGCHINAKVPANQHESYINRKFFHSVILQGICNSRKILIDVFVGFPGSANDKRASIIVNNIKMSFLLHLSNLLQVLRNSGIYQRIQNKGEADVFVGKDYHLLGDSGYFLNNWLMIPYENRGSLNRKQKYFNHALSSTRVVIENVFGQLKGRWRILKFVDVNSIKKVVKIIITCCILHNFCLMNKDIFEEEFDENEETNADFSSESGNREAKVKRDTICNMLSRC